MIQGGGLKEKILAALLFLFVLVVIATFAYFFLLSPRPSGRPEAKVFFFREEKLASFSRRAPAGKPPEKTAIDELLAGPTKAEKEKGCFTEIPDGTKAKRVFIEGDTVFIDFNERVGEYGGGTARIQGIVAQIVYTMTEIRGIRKVSILVNGKSEVPLGGEGYMIGRFLSRGDVSF